ncbi:MAG TPA: RHS repeat domain-containing protein [Longimicrobiales bacterium]
MDGEAGRLRVGARLAGERGLRGSATGVWEGDRCGSEMAGTGRLVPDRISGLLGVHYAYGAAGRPDSTARGGGTVRFGYDAGGFLASVTGPRLRTERFDHDPAGRLTRQVLPDGMVIESVIDGQNRRVGKKVNGVLVRAWLYGDRINPVAELDSTGAVVARFVYGSRLNVPDYMVKGGATYRIVADQVGSVRLVVDASTGEVVQRIDYGSSGEFSVESIFWRPRGHAACVTASCFVSGLKTMYLRSSHCSFLSIASAPKRRISDASFGKMRTTRLRRRTSA